MKLCPFEIERIFPGAFTERARLRGGPTWLGHELIATECARERLRSWHTSGGLDRPAPAIRDTALFFGDDSMLPAIIAAFEQMAPPARDFVLDAATIFGTGWATRGWTGATPFRSRPRVILLSGSSRDPEVVRRVMLHEASHVWLEPASTAPISAAGHADFIDLGRRDGWYRDLEQQRIRGIESRANTLAAEWERLRRIT